VISVKLLNIDKSLQFERNPHLRIGLDDNEHAVMESSWWSRYRQAHPLVALSLIFAAWKALLAVIVLAAPSIGYDTSTSLLPISGQPHNATTDVPLRMLNPLSKFVRWDAIYYTHMSDVGHVFEQEWAFGIGLSTSMTWLVRGSRTPVLAIA
jgi:hypothetical protein